MQELPGADFAQCEVASSACPLPAERDAICAQQVVVARNPNTDDCCTYATPCDAPVGWDTFANMAPAWASEPRPIAPTYQAHMRGPAASRGAAGPRARERVESRPIPRACAHIGRAE